MIPAMIRTLSPRLLGSCLSAALCLSLVSCGGGGTAAVCTQQFWNGTVGLCLPDGWKVMERERLDQLGVPQEVVAGFQTEKPVAGQYPSVVVTREALSQPMDSATYSRASQRAVSVLPGYEIIDARPVTVDGKAVTLHVYTAQPMSDQPKSRFYQVSAVSGSGTGYTVTAFTPLSVSSSLDRQVVAIVSSLTFTQKK